MDGELKELFPSRFSSTSELEYYDSVRRRAMLQLNEIIKEADNEKKILEEDKYIIELFDPKAYYGKANYSTTHKKNFEETCATLRAELKTDPKLLTMVEFYAQIEALTNKK